uniref:Uncharacterized protein n=1 Tax=Panagrolaimus davidi TaxID=227884 RepID=A0A914Q817_9BILA
MRFMFVVAAFLLLFEYGNSRVPIGMPHEGGCHKFSGKIFCESGDSILPTATVRLWEADRLDDKFLNGGDDFVVAAPIARDGTFEFEACKWDKFLFWKRKSVEFYLEFLYACPNVVYTYNDFTHTNRFFYYIIPKEGHFIIHSDEFLDMIDEYLPK